jgi:hypothetical protein
MSDPFTRHRVEPDRPKAASEQPISVDPQKPLGDQSGPVATSNPFGDLKIEPRPKAPLEPERKPLSTQELLHWLKYRGKPTVCLRDVRKQGPRSIRDRKSAITHLEALVERGWLVELRAFRCDRRVWALPPGMVATKN